MTFMNYIKEINSFYQRQETNPLSSSAANLWHTLMHVNNRAGWKNKFTVAISVLCCKANLTNSTFKRARTELRDKGYIRYESQRGNRSAIYRIVSLEQSTADQNSGHDEDADQNIEEYFGQETKVQSKVANILDHNPAPLFKQKETKQKITTAAADAIDFFQKNIGVISPYIMGDVIKWISDIGQPLVLAAMKRALERGKANWGYIKGILESWLDKGVKTIGEAEGEVLEFKNKQKKRKGSWSSQSASREVIPEWFHERNKAREESEVEIENEDTERERREVDELLAMYASG